MKHTKGPWNSYSDGSKAWVKCNKNKLVAEMSDDADRCDADARLIAAAPEMLEELIFVAERLHAEKFDADLVENITNLIKKAKGE